MHKVPAQFRALFTLQYYTSMLLTLQSFERPAVAAIQTKLHSLQPAIDLLQTWSYAVELQQQLLHCLLQLSKFQLRSQAGRRQRPCRASTSNGLPCSKTDRRNSPLLHTANLRNSWTQQSLSLGSSPAPATAGQIDPKCWGFSLHLSINRPGQASGR